mmetsp:Transcript_5039/g.11092  ORF Transcript_5039/g.11092 Transcript_5039/m.11092 type:complete len:975 (+) Transcript_5039:406-3330(+)
MPPKQKMGSITHNSAEVNRGSSKVGMLSKIKGSFVASSSRSGMSSKAGDKKNNNNKKEKDDMSKSGLQTVGESTKASKQNRRYGSPSFTNGDSTIHTGLSEDFHTTTDRGVPTSITALVDAASVMTDEFDTPQGGGGGAVGRYGMNQDFRPQRVEQRRRRRSMDCGVSTDAASRALVNLNIAGGSGIVDQGGMLRENSAEWGKNPTQDWGHGSGQDWGHGSGQDWGHGSGGNWGVVPHPAQHGMVQGNNNGGGYNNYKYEGYDDFEDDGGGGAYYDDRGGGIFDDSYMNIRQPRVSSANAQERGLERGYSGRRTSNAESVPYYRRASDACNSYGAATSIGMNLYRGSSQDAGDPNPHRMSQMSMNYGNSQSEQQKRNSIENAGSAPLGNRRRISVEHDPRKSGLGHNNNTGPAQKNIVNNTGRGGDSGQNSASRAKSPNSSHSSKSSSMKMSTMSSSAKQNPSWFTEQHSGSTDHVQNQNIVPHKDKDLRSSRRYQDEDDKTMTTMMTKDQALRPSAMIKAKDMSSPTGDVTIVFTDVRGSTLFWETCPTDMKKATDIHDIIMRQCYTNHSGYEITTEGDSFNLAFQHPVDALAFALQAQQKLYKADWPEGILKHPEGKDEPTLKFRGFRVRFGIHHGPTTSRIHEMTGRTLYTGEAVKIAKAVEGMCHGGQILTTVETWKAVSGMAERYLGRPQVLDCGEHLLFESKSASPGKPGGYTTTRYTTTRYTRRVMQLVPSELAFDFFEARGRRDVLSEDGKMEYEIKDASSVTGRLFPPLTSKRQLTTCFLNAPYANGRVTICFVYTVGLDENPDTKTKNLGVLAKSVRKKMLVLNPPGYECQEDNGCWMLAFDRMAHAVTFGIQLKAAMQAGVEDLMAPVDCDNMFKVGILSGPFTSMGPHKTTGMADYFGPIVNRAARVASNCEPGQVCVGIPLSNGVTADPPDFGPSIDVNLQGIKRLKGITIDMAIFACSKN